MKWNKLIDKDGLIIEFGMKDILSMFGACYFLPFLIGLYTIGTSSLLWAVIYIIVFLVATLAFTYFFCTKCPYYGCYCYFLTGKLASLIFSPRHGKYTFLDTVMLVISFTAIYAFPQYWLWEFPFLLILFWLLIIMAFAYLFIKMCSTCKNLNCPFYHGLSDGGTTSIRL